MSFSEFEGWVAKHPTESIVIGGAGVLALLWLFGFFGSSSSSDSGSSNLAAAYYAAEAQQAVVGGQIQMANIAATASTAQAVASDNAAVAINKAQTGAAVKINGQNATSAATINGQNVASANYIASQGAGVAINASNDQLQATYSNNATALDTVQSNNAAAVTMNQNTNNANLMSSWINTILPTEFATYGGSGFSTNLPGGLGSFSTSVLANPNLAKAEGFTAAGAEKTFGWPAGSVQG